MTIDTNILIAYLIGEDKVVRFLSDWRRQGGFLHIPTIVEAELLSYSKWTLKEQNLVEEFLEENFISVSFSRPIARISAEIRKDANIKFPDAAIAASALFTKTPLLTRNIKDFAKIKELKLLTL